MTDASPIRPRIDAIVFCNEIRREGPFTHLLGVVSEIWARTPATGPFCVYVVTSGARKDADLFFEFVLVGEDIDAPDHRIAHGPIRIRVNGPKTPGPDVPGECFIEETAHFPRAGEYRFRIKHKGETIADRALIMHDPPKENAR